MSVQAGAKQQCAARFQGWKRQNLVQHRMDSRHERIARFLAIRIPAAKADELSCMLADRQRVRGLLGCNC